MTWARLALVGFFLDNTGCTIETIAAELSFASDTALRNTIKRYVGRRATEIRQTGAFHAVVVAFSERIRFGHPPARETSLHLV
jgi:methylphosphotriester-DNA--protein-cysteine methyltransferase